MSEELGFNRASTIDTVDRICIDIKHREFSSLHKAWNARIDTDLFGQRSQNEAVNSRLKRKYGAFVRSRHWWKQFRELVIKCVVHNLERNLAVSDKERDCP